MKIYFTNDNNVCNERDSEDLRIRTVKRILKYVIRKKQRWAPKWAGNQICILHSFEEVMTKENQTFYGSLEVTNADRLIKPTHMCIRCSSSRRCGMTHSIPITCSTVDMRTLINSTRTHNTREKPLHENESCLETRPIRSAFSLPDWNMMKNVEK